MKRDEIAAIFPGATEEQISTLLNGIGAELNPLKKTVTDLTGQLTAANGELKASRDSEGALQAKVAELTSQVQSGMSAEELLKQREEAAAAKEREFTLKSNSLEAKSLFVGAGFSTEDIEQLLPRVVSEDAEATKTAAQALVDLDKRRRDEVAQSTKAALLKQNPGLNGGTGEGQITAESFNKMTFSEQMKLVQENPGLLKQLDATD